MRTSFVYHPKAGDRVFAEGAHETIVIVRWANGCRHVLGGELLRYVTAEPGRWWRSAAKVVATAIVRSVGGIAWDEQGVVHLVVPRAAVIGAHALMREAQRSADVPETSQEVAAATVALLLAGYQLPTGLLTFGFEHGPAPAASAPAAPVLIVTGCRESSEAEMNLGLDADVDVRAEGDAASLRPKAPDAWRIRSIIGGRDAGSP